MSELLVIGAGTIGRATGNGFASSGHRITFADLDDRVLAELTAKGNRAVRIGEIDWSSLDVVFVCVPTRPAAGDSPFDAVFDTVDLIASGLRHAKRRVIIAIRSTLVPGTTVNQILPRLTRTTRGRVGIDWSLVVNPEFLREASSDTDFQHPWLTVIGAADDSSSRFVEDLYSPFGAPVVHCTQTEAELIKMGCNCYNAVKISFFNELGALCEKLGANGVRVSAAIAAGAEGMWNPLYGTRPGAPFGGACLPQDLANMASAVDGNGWENLLLDAALQVNRRMHQRHHADQSDRWRRST